MSSKICIQRVVELHIHFDNFSMAKTKSYQQRCWDKVIDMWDKWLLSWEKGVDYFSENIGTLGDANNSRIFIVNQSVVENLN